MSVADTDAAVPHSMEALATLPIFFKLAGRTVVLAGATLPAVWKAELLAAAGADVRCFDPAPSPEMLALAVRLPAGKLTIVEKPWSSGDLDGAALAIGAIEDADEAARFRAAAQGAGVPVNVIDRPDACDFQFGTILARSPIVIGISTDGAAPVFGQALRARIEAVLPANLGAWAVAARAWRPAVQERRLGFRGRRRFWEAFSKAALAGGAPRDEVLRACLDAALSDESAKRTGQVVLVGSGQGTPESTTLGAIASLQSADCVIYDADVSPAVIGLARREADKQSSDGMTVADVCALASTKTVVWLGTGDPATCGRWTRRREDLGRLDAVVSAVGAPAICPACPIGCQYRSPS